MLATRNFAWSCSVWAWSDIVSGGRCASASAAWSTLLPPRTAWTRSATVAAAMTWAVAWSGCRLTRISPGPDRSAGMSMTISTPPSLRAASAAVASA